ncbi:MAG: DUF1016 domain-containing protein, partial [Bacteroidetes bacterium]|nr:DUF1016 domain-containing protein [Bacteroidota bacterium]
MEKPTLTFESLWQAARGVIQSVRAQAHRAINSAMLSAYWELGRLIVEEEQHGKERADYGEALVESLATRLTEEFGKGFTRDNLWLMRQFYLTFPIPDALRRELTWTHYRLLMRVQNEQARQFYEEESIRAGWSTRALERQIHSFYYERLLASRSDRAGVAAEAEEKTSPLAASPRDFIKDPYVLEFLELQAAPALYEQDLEQALIDNLQQFLLELGRGFSFVARQQYINLDGDEFRIDLVFYNYLLKCFVLFDLKIGKLEHKDIGQMD